MRLLITAVASPVPGAPAAPHDLVVDTEDGATVGDLALALGRRLHTPLASSGQGGGGHLRLVAAPAPAPAQVGASPDGSAATGGYADAGTAPAPDLYLGDERLDPGQPLAASAVRHGSIVGLGVGSDRMVTHGQPGDQAGAGVRHT